MLTVLLRERGILQEQCYEISSMHENLIAIYVLFLEVNCLLIWDYTFQVAVIWLSFEKRDPNPCIFNQLKWTSTCTVMMKQEKLLCFMYTVSTVGISKV